MRRSKYYEVEPEVIPEGYLLKVNYRLRQLGQEPLTSDPSERMIALAEFKERDNQILPFFVPVLIALVSAGAAVATLKPEWSSLSGFFWATVVPVAILGIIGYTFTDARNAAVRAALEIKKERQRQGL